MRLDVTIITLLFLCSCASTDPRSAADIRYHLPRTDAKATLTLTLKECNSLLVDADVQILPLNGAQDGEIVLPGSALASARIKRSLKVEKGDDDVIIGVNSTNSERTPQTIGNYIQALEKVLPAVFGLAAQAAPRLQCSESTRIAVERAAAIRKRIDQLRAASDNSSVNTRQIELLAKELGALDSIVKIDVSGTLLVEKGRLGSKEKPNEVRLSSSKFKSWFGPDSADNAEIPKNFGLVWWAEKSSVSEIPVHGSLTTNMPRECKFAMPIPAPLTLVVHVTGSGSQIAGLTATESMPAAQLGDPRELCLDVGFGETRTISLVLDKYGRTTVYNWESEATAEIVSQAVAGSASGLATILQTVRGKSELDRKKQEVDELETEQKLQKLRACKAMMDTGVSCE